uniref:Elongation factor Ts, mitochondrial n=1 Tax=Araucaria cunninghamii TaxID=56994 RepID=A0A0D6R8N7_ARACU
MACSMKAQRPFSFLLRQLKGHNCYYSSGARSNHFHGHPAFQSNVATVQSTPTSHFTGGVLGFGKICRRSYSAEVGAAKQVNLIKQLRERTSAPMKDVKASLLSCNWDLEAAYTDLRKKGIAGISKKASRVAAEGTLALAQYEKLAAVVEINCETDFVARNEMFQYLALSVARSLLAMESLPKFLSQAGTIDPKVLEEMKIILDHPKLSGETTVQNAIMEVAAMMGENMKLRRGFALSSTTGVVLSYLHASPQPGLGRIAGLLTLESENGSAPCDVLQNVGSNLAMHVVASRPLFLSKDHVSAEALEAERDILKTQAAASGKPQAAIEKMVEGRLRKYVEDVALLEQKFVMNDKVNVKLVLEDLSKEVGQKIRVGRFLRVEVGEGIQRQETDFASEVAAQVG